MCRYDGAVTAWEQALDAVGANGDEEIEGNLKSAKDKAAKAEELNGKPIGIGAGYNFNGGAFKPHNATMPKACAQ